MLCLMPVQGSEQNIVTAVVLQPGEEREVIQPLQPVADEPAVENGGYVEGRREAQGVPDVRARNTSA